MKKFLSKAWALTAALTFAASASTSAIAAPEMWNAAEGATPLLQQFDSGVSGSGEGSVPAKKTEIADVAIKVEGQTVSVSGKINNMVEGQILTVLVVKSSVTEFGNADDSDIGYIDEIPVTAAGGAFSFSFTLKDGLKAADYNLVLGGTGIAEKVIKSLDAGKVVITKITVSSFPSKTKYEKGDALSVAGGKLTLQNSKGESETMSMTKSMVSGFDSSKTGTQTLTVTYTQDGVSITGENTYEITVSKPSTPSGGSGTKPGGTALNPKPTEGPTETPAAAIKVSLKDGANLTYISGYEDGTFGPQNPISRAEVITILDRICNVTGATGKQAAFTDIGGHWAKDAISKFSEAGIVNGYGDTFGPDRSMTRAEFSAVICRAMGADVTGLTSDFPDVSHHFAEGYITHLKNQGIISGYEDGTFGPDNPITRAEAVVMINRLLKIEKDDGAEQKFTDVDRGFWAFADIAAAAK